MAKNIKDHADDLNEDALSLIGQVMRKHTAAILEEMRDQLKIKDVRIRELERLLEHDGNE